jgi:hypothetical protein
MAWRLRAGVSLHPMPFGGAFVLDDARLAARQISSELAQLLTGAGTGTGTGAGTGVGSAPHDPPPPVLAAELRLGLDDGWLIHQDDMQRDDKQGDEQEGNNA